MLWIWCFKRWLLKRFLFVIRVSVSHRLSTTTKGKLLSAHMNFSTVTVKTFTSCWDFYPSEEVLFLRSGSWLCSDARGCGQTPCRAALMLIKGPRSFWGSIEDLNILRLQTFTCFFLTCPLQLPSQLQHRLENPSTPEFWSYGGNTFRLKLRSSSCPWLNATGPISAACSVSVLEPDADCRLAASLTESHFA